jgi:hypothetical protein
VAEYFRDCGFKVLLMMDSVTRFAQAQRQIGLAGGEPPTTRGYTPSVFAELPKLLERAGPGVGKGSISGIFSVLVEGSDMEEPVADAVRGILDGHIVLTRALAERNHFPAIDVLQSVSRTVPQCLTQQEWQVVSKTRQLLSAYEDMAELIRLGAYTKGSDPLVDEALAKLPAMHAFLKQAPDEGADAAQSFGGAQNGKRIGALTDMTATSFYPSKTLGCYGDGGAMLTDDAARFDRWSSIRWHGTDAVKQSHRRTPSSSVRNSSPNSGSVQREPRRGCCRVLAHPGCSHDRRSKPGEMAGATPMSDTAYAWLAVGVAVVFVTVVLVTGRSRERNPHVDARTRHPTNRKRNP